MHIWVVVCTNDLSNAGTGCGKHMHSRWLNPNMVWSRILVQLIGACAGLADVCMVLVHQGASL